MPKNKAINLLPQEEFNASTTGRVLKWATGTFRIIVIATEMIVMAAFLSRFWLDAQNSNLNSSIKVKSAQISAQSDIEKQFRNVQLKLNIFDKIGQSNKTSEMVEGVTSNVPQNTSLSRISITEGEISIHGASPSEYEVGQFLSNLQNSQFKNVELRQVSSSEDNPAETDFVISITY
jgi:Tfp pilus assembly protein PilN